MLERKALDFARCSILSLRWPQNEFHSKICQLEVKTSQFTDFMQPFSFLVCAVSQKNI